MASAEALSIALRRPGGGEPLRLAWDRGSAESLAAAGTGEGRRSPWRLEGELDAGADAELRLISAAFDDGRALALAALRPRGAAGHDLDSVAQHLEESGRPIVVGEALLSTEYDAEGLSSGPIRSPPRCGLPAIARATSSWSEATSGAGSPACPSGSTGPAAREPTSSGELPERWRCGR
jgi:hypothetical protein